MIVSGTVNVDITCIDNINFLNEINFMKISFVNNSLHIIIIFYQPEILIINYSSPIKNETNIKLSRLEKTDYITSLIVVETHLQTYIIIGTNIGKLIILDFNSQKEIYNNKLEIQSTASNQNLNIEEIYNWKTE